VITTVLIALLFFVGFIAAMMFAIVKIGRGRGRGRITGPVDSEIDYDNPYVGTYLWTNKRQP
jgi:hypothetical protein